MAVIKSNIPSKNKQTKKQVSVALIRSNIPSTTTKNTGFCGRYKAQQCFQKNYGGQRTPSAALQKCIQRLRLAKLSLGEATRTFHGTRLTFGAVYRVQNGTKGKKGKKLLGGGGRKDDDDNNNNNKRTRKNKKVLSYARIFSLPQYDDPQ